MASGWNLWVWLVSVVVRRYIPYSGYFSRGINFRGQLASAKN